jgi:hypothetical protein
MIATRTLLTTALLMTIAFAAGAVPLTKVEYKAGKADIAARLKAGKLACDAHTGNARDICVEEAKGAAKVARAELQAGYEPSTKHTYEIGVAKAKSAFAVDKEKCDDQTGNPKDVCRKEADAAYTTAMAGARLTETTSMNNKAAADEINGAKAQAMDKNATARKDANTDIREAQYKAAAEKCDAFAADAKAKCLTEAKARFGN